MSENTELVTVVSGANVTFSFKGLGLGSYNKTNKNWEFICLGYKNHNLEITVNKYKARKLEESNVYQIDHNERIFIRSNGAESQSPRYDAGDKKDLGRVIDFSSKNLYDSYIKFNKTNDVPLTFLSVSDCICYTKKLSTSKFSIRSDKGVVGKPKKIGEVLAADIVNKIGSKTELLVSGKPSMIPPLVAEKDVIYEVVMDNSCPNPPAGSKSDFDLYVESFDMLDTFTLELPAGEDKGEKHPLCNFAIVSDLDNVASLGDLLE